MPSEYQKLELIARVSGEADTLYWYQDGKLVTSTRPYKKLFILLEAGTHRLVVVDSSGRSDSVTYRVDSEVSDRLAER